MTRGCDKVGPSTGHSKMKILHLSKFESLCIDNMVPSPAKVHSSDLSVAITFTDDICNDSQTRGGGI